MTRHCQWHCGGCHSHFSSLAAFDAHRSGPWDGERVCRDPDLETGLRVAVQDGTCEMYVDVRFPIAIWEHAARVDEARAYFKKRGRKKPVGKLA